MNLTKNIYIKDDWCMIEGEIYYQISFWFVIPILIMWK